MLQGNLALPQPLHAVCCPKIEPPPFPHYTAKTSYKDPLPPKSRTGRVSGNPSYLGKYMYLLNVRCVKINCMECNIFYGMHVKGVEGINKYMYLLKE